MVWREKLSTVHAALAFVLPFLLFLPLLLFFSLKESWHRYALVIHQWWAFIFFRLLWVPIEIEWHFKPSRKGQYLFCANHFSFFDIPAVGLLPSSFKFVGKASLAEVPVFGYIYKRIHITVERGNPMKSAQTQIKVKKAIDHGFSITYFPEGGIVSNDPPKMGSFKDGVFKIACESQLPIVPISLCTNYLLFPDDPKLIFYRGKMKMIIHKPFQAKANTPEEMIRLKELVRSKIEEGLEAPIAQGKL